MGAGFARWCWPALGEPQAVEEVLQDVAVATVEHGHRLRDPAKIAPWLYRVAVVAALQYRRRAGRGRKLLDRFAERMPPTEADDREPDPLDWLAGRGTADARAAGAWNDCRGAMRKSCC